MLKAPVQVVPEVHELLVVALGFDPRGHLKAGHWWTGQIRPPRGAGLSRGLLLTQVGVELGAPAARAALEDISVMEEPVQ
jgi:hypothetical protein